MFNQPDAIDFHLTDFLVFKTTPIGYVGKKVKVCNI